MIATASSSLGQGPQGPQRSDIPQVLGARAVTGTSGIYVTCGTVLPTVPARVQCKVTQTIISKPAPQYIAREVAAVRQAANKPWSAWLPVCADTGERYTPEYLEKIKKACARKDKTALVEAAIWRIENVEANTCTFQSFPSDDFVFTRLDANTWTTTTTGVLCPLVTTITLWRKKADDMSWNYKQTRVVPPNLKDDSLCNGFSDSTDEWRWSMPPIKKECVYIDY